MACPSPYPPELRERAVRMVAEIRPNYSTEWAAMKAVAAKLGIGTAETVRTWVRTAEVNAGQRPGRTSEEATADARISHRLTNRPLSELLGHGALQLATLALNLLPLAALRLEQLMRSRSGHLERAAQRNAEVSLRRARVGGAR
ncbi:hypothetical protein OK006_8283 [Actinobacteria bacterium OK006]|nr:hypothetical protein OK006_8283 [Actinobacteria bacterium OK006]